MTGHQAHDPNYTGRRPRHSDDYGHSRHRGHGWMMIACCIPMIVIAVALVAAGVVSPSFLFVPLACTALMALIMQGMGPRRRGRRLHP